MTSFWSGYITVLTLGTIFALTWLLLDTRKGQRSDQTDEKVGHAYDGIEEFDNPLQLERHFARLRGAGH